MLNSLDLLVIAFMVIMSLSVLAVLLMLLMKNKLVKRIALYVCSAITAYVGIAAFVNFSTYFLGQAIVGLLAAISAVAAIVLERISAKKQDEKLFRIARITALAALAAGVINIFFI